MSRRDSKLCLSGIVASICGGIRANAVIVLVVGSKVALSSLPNGASLLTMDMVL